MHLLPRLPSSRVRKFLSVSAAGLALLTAAAHAHTIEVGCDDLGLPVGAFLNGSDGRGGFDSANVRFQNSYNPDWGSWSGFAVSRVNNTNTAGFGNQYAVWTPGVGQRTAGAYAVGYDNPWDEQDIVHLPFPSCVKGFYVNNTTYAALSMRDGDPFAKKFGGASGNDPDWFLLTVTARDDAGAVLGARQVYLADFRFADPADDYILGDWTWVDLAAFGASVRTLHFALTSSDNGAWGMNTPAYFALDGLEIVPRPCVLTTGVDRVSLPAGQEYDNGSRGFGAFRDQAVRFGNVFTDWGGGFFSWSGFAVSRVNNTNTAGFGNQYAVWTPGTDRSGNGQYLVGYDDAFNPDADTIALPYPALVKGFHVNNTTYAALAMRDGDLFAKKFGGATGNDPDWFLLTVTARDDTGAVLGTRQVYLADYRFTNNAQDYILGRWTWVDLAGIGPDVKTLHFALTSSDNGAWGMNTPAYFALDDLSYVYTFGGGMGDANVPDAGVPGFVGPNGIGKTGGGNTVNPAFAAWATGVHSYSPAPGVAATWTNTSLTLGPVTGTNTHIASLGDLTAAQLATNATPGRITLSFAAPIADERGPDFAVFENGFLVAGSTRVFGELGYVEVSSDGATFVRFPAVSLSTNTVGPFAGHDVRHVYNLCGKHVNASGNSWGTPFDLADLACHPLVLTGTVALTNITHVRIVDIPGNGSFHDSFAPSNRVYDPWPTSGSGGVDLEAIGVLNSPSAARIEVAVVGPGSVTPYGYPDGLVAVANGGTQTFTITPAPGYRVVDVLVDGRSVGPTNAYTFAAVRSDRTLEVRFGSRLTVVSDWGSPTPPTGTHDYVYGTIVTGHVAASQISGTTQHVSAGWVRVGSAPAAGATTQTTFAITNDTVLTWHWSTNHWLAARAAGRGRVDNDGGWYAATGSVTVTATPDPYYAFAGWAGDTQGDTNLAAMTVRMNRPRSLTATFAAEETVHNVPVAWLVAHGLTDGTPEERALADPDGDGQPTWHEFYGGSNPTNAASRFVILGLARAGGTNEVRWFGGANGSARPFEVLSAPAVTGAWAVTAGNIARAPDGTNIWRQPDESAVRFYRVRVQGAP